MAARNCLVAEDLTCKIADFGLGKDAGYKVGTAGAGALLWLFRYADSFVELLQAHSRCQSACALDGFGKLGPGTVLHHCFQYPRAITTCSVLGSIYPCQRCMGSRGFDLRGSLTKSAPVSHPDFVANRCFHLGKCHTLQCQTWKC